MTLSRCSPERRDERGVALIAVLLLLLLMSALAAALTVSGRTETLVARNQESAAQARDAAEAGLNHIAELLTTWIFQWRQNCPTCTSVDQALDTLLGNVGAVGVPIATDIFPIAGSTDIRYQVFVMDEDDPARAPDNTQLLDDADAANNEDGVATTDNNKALIVRAVGWARDNTTVTLEAVVAELRLPAVVTGGDVVLNGSVTIDGAEGSIHSNGDLNIDSSSYSIAQDASASGDLPCASAQPPCPGVGGDVTAGAVALPLPNVRASDYRFNADYLLDAAGAMKCENSAGCGGIPDGGLIIDCSVPSNGNDCRTMYGLDFESGPTWSFENAAATGTYYVDGVDVVISGPTTSLTVIAAKNGAGVGGNIDVGGNTDLTPDTPELLFVADGDLDINSSAVQIGTISAQGQILVHEQISINAASLAGQIIVEDAVDTAGSPVSRPNTISGSATITYSGGLGTSSFTVMGWREVRR